MSSSTTSFGTAEIIGIVIGGVLTLVTLIGIIISVYAMCCKKDPNSQVQPQPQQQQRQPYGQQMNTGYYGPQSHPNSNPGYNPYSYEQPPPSYHSSNPRSYAPVKY